MFVLDLNRVGKEINGHNDILNTIKLQGTCTHRDIAELNHRSIKQHQQGK